MCVLASNRVSRGGSDICFININECVCWQSTGCLWNSDMYFITIHVKSLFLTIKVPNNIGSLGRICHQVWAMVLACHKYDKSHLGISGMPPI